MKVEDKLNKFYEHSLDSANAEAARIISSHQKALDQLFEEHKKEKERQTASQLHDESEKLKRESNKLLSAEQLDIRRSISLKDMELKEQLFKEVEEKLKNFRRTPEYTDYLVRKIRDAVSAAGTEKIEVYVDEEDAALVKKLSGETGTAVGISREKLGGGIHAVIPEQHLLIDYSFVSLLQEEKDSFTFREGEADE